MLGRPAGERSGALPELVPPMVVTPAADLPTGPDWAVEFAWEGLRALAYVVPGRLRLLTAASDRDVTASFPELVGPLTGAVPRRGAVFDGTVVALGEGGFPRRRLLQARSATSRPSEIQMRRTPVGYFVGDLLWLDGRSLCERPYHRRRERLARLRLASPVVVSPSFPLDEVGHVLRAAEQHGVDALHARHLDAPYRPGRRTRTWLRVSRGVTAQVLVGGWTPADPRRPDSVAVLLVGVPDGRGGLRYVGRVGLGAGTAHRDTAQALAALRADDSPFAGSPAVPGDAQWARPELAGLVEFAGWTADARMRLPRWRGVLTAEEAGTWAQPPVPAVLEPAQPDPEPVVVEAAQPDPARSLDQHFVYNALNTIASLVRTDPNQARELLHGFADLTRATDRPAGATATLGEELAAVRAYLKLEQARFGDRLRVELDVDPALHPVPIRPTALLAVVRDIVQRRIEPLPGGGTLAVRVVDGGVLVAHVEEAGAMPDATTVLHLDRP